MITLCFVLLGLLGATQQEPQAPPLLPQSPADEVLESWQFVSKVSLELPSGTRFILRSLRFLEDGSLVLKRGSDRSIRLFGPDGSQQREWNAPAGHGDWRRVSYGCFVGDQADSLWFLPGSDRTVPAKYHGYRLWRKAGSEDPETLRFPGRDFLATEGGTGESGDEWCISWTETCSPPDPSLILKGIPS